MDPSQFSSYNCDICQKPCGNRTNYFVHRRLKHAEQLSHECVFCRMRCATDDFLREHILSSHAGEESIFGHYSCQFCDARFKDKCYLDSHMLTHNEYTPLGFDRWKPNTQTQSTSSSSYTCEICQKPCGNRTNYLVHLRLKHAEELAHECEVCEMRFATDEDLRQHFLTAHEGGARFLGRFSCEVCGERFVEKRLLDAHMLTHNEYTPMQINHRKSGDKKKDRDGIKSKKDREKRMVKNYSCTKCRRVFHEARHLELHLRIHRTMFTCQECSGNAHDFHRINNVKTSQPAISCTEEEDMLSSDQQHNDSPTKDLQGLPSMLISSDFVKVEGHTQYNCKVSCCFVCYREFSCPDPETTDQQLNSSEEYPVCDICSRAFSCKDRKEMHTVVSFADKNTVQCKVCMKRFRNRNPAAVVDEMNPPLNPYSCNICGLTYLRKSGLRRHVKTHQQEYKYICSLCIEVFQTKKAFKRHMISHKKGHYKCPDCDAVFANKKYLKKHQKLHSERVKRKKERKGEHCSVCGQYFSRRKYLLLHQKTHIQGKYTCIQCRKTFPLKSMLLDHLKIHERSKEPSTEFSCSICKLSCVNQIHLDNHKLIHAGAKISVCDLCGQYFNHRYEVIEHKEKVHSHYSCSVCQKGFSSSKALDFHNKEGHGKDRPKCHICPKVCVNELHLSNHLLIHAGRRIRICEICGKGFPTTNQLVTHIECHTGQKPHCCDICHEGFSETSELMIHRKKHEEDHPGLVIGDDFIKQEVMSDAEDDPGQEPQRCMICLEEFLEASELLIHMKMHEGDQSASHTGDESKEEDTAGKEGSIYQENHRCRICLVAIPDPSELLMHTKMHMKNSEAQYSEVLDRDELIHSENMGDLKKL